MKNDLRVKGLGRDLEDLDLIFSSTTGFLRDPDQVTQSPSLSSLSVN